MEFRIHYEIDNYEDSIDIEGDTLEEIRAIAKAEKENRGLDLEKNNMWSERLDEEDLYFLEYSNARARYRDVL